MFAAINNFAEENFSDVNAFLASWPAIGYH